MLRTTLVLLTGLWFAGAAAAAPVLRPNIEVNAAVVTVGDMFDDAGSAAGTALFRAPNPGTSALVGLADINSALTRIGIDRFDANGLDGIQVSRAAAIVDETVLAGLIAADLAERGIITSAMTADTLFATPIAPIKAEAVAEPASLISLRYLPGSGAFTARFTIAGIVQPLDVSGSIALLIEVPHIISSLPAGTLLAPTNIRLRPVPLKFVESTGVARVEDLIGKSLLRPAREGMMLKVSDVTVPLTITKNDLVTIYFRKGPMTLTVKGQAVTGGVAGGQVQVLNLMSRRVISAAVLSAGAVEVDAGPLTIAGL